MSIISSSNILTIINWSITWSHSNRVKKQKLDYFGAIKVGCIFSMVMWSEIRLGQYRDDDHRENAQLKKNDFQEYF